jgi:hypothetical protein
MSQLALLNLTVYMAIQKNVVGNVRVVNSLSLSLLAGSFQSISLSTTAAAGAL